MCNITNVVHEERTYVPGNNHSIYSKINVESVQVQTLSCDFHSLLFSST